MPFRLRLWDEGLQSHSRSRDRYPGYSGSQTTMRPSGGGVVHRLPVMSNSRVPRKSSSSTFPPWYLRSPAWSWNRCAYGALPSVNRGRQLAFLSFQTILSALSTSSRPQIKLSGRIRSITCYTEVDAPAKVGGYTHSSTTISKLSGFLG